MKEYLMEYEIWELKSLNLLEASSIKLLDSCFLYSILFEAKIDSFS